MEEVIKAADPLSPENAAKRYFEYMDKMRLDRIEELEQQIGWKGARIGHLELDIKNWREAAQYNNKWRATVEEFRTIVITLGVLALIGYGMYRHFDSRDIEAVRMPCPITKIVGQ